jgi:hypothetical protein
LVRIVGENAGAEESIESPVGAFEEHGVSADPETIEIVDRLVAPHHARDVIVEHQRVRAYLISHIRLIQAKPAETGHDGQPFVRGPAQVDFDVVQTGAVGQERIHRSRGSAECVDGHSECPIQLVGGGPAIDLKVTHLEIAHVAVAD